MLRFSFLAHGVLCLVCMLAAPAHAIPAIETAAVVNDQLISSLDVNERITLMIVTTGLEDTPEQRQQLKPQVLRMLVEEQLQLAEAQRLSLKISEEDLGRAIGSIEERSQKPKGSLEQYLQSRGVPLRTFYQQMRAQVAWGKILSRQIRARVNVTDEEVTRETARVLAKSGGQEVNISTLTLPVDQNSTSESIQELAKNVVAQIQGGTPIGVVAAQLSGGQAETAAEAVWVDIKDLDKTISGFLEKAPAGSLVGPVKTQTGFQIIRLNDRRTSRSDGLDKPIEIVLKQILFRLANDAPATEVDATLESVRQVQENPGTCLDQGAAGMSNPKELGIDVNFLRTLVQQLPEELRTLVMEMSVGTVSEPIATPQGMALVVLCERIEKPEGTVMDEKVRERLLQEKLMREAARYMRELRTNATIDIKPL